MASLRSLRDLSIEELTQRLESFASVPPYPFTAPPPDPEFDRRVNQLVAVARESPEMLYLTSVRYHTYKDPAGDEWLWAAGGGEVGRELGSKPTDEQERSERHMNFSRGLPRNEAEYLAWRQSAPQVISVSYPTIPKKRRKLSRCKTPSSPPCPADAMLSVHHVPASSSTSLTMLAGSARSGQNDNSKSASSSSSPIPQPPSSISNVNIGSQEPTPPSSSDRAKQTLRHVKELARKARDGYMRDELPNDQPEVPFDQSLLTFKRTKRRSSSASANGTKSTDKRSARQLGNEKIKGSTLAEVEEGTKEGEEDGSIQSVERALGENAEEGSSRDAEAEKDKLKVLKKREWENLLDQSAFDLFYPPSFPSDLSCSTPNSKRSAPPPILSNLAGCSEMAISLPATSEPQPNPQPTSPLTSKPSLPQPNPERVDNSVPKKASSSSTTTTITTTTAISLKRKGLANLSTRSSSSSASIFGPSAQDMTSGMDRTISGSEFDGSQSFLFGFGGSQIEKQIEGLNGFLRDELND